jgi:hypothetical protein
MRVAKWLVVVVLALVAAPAWAQVDEKSVNVNLGGGYTFTVNGDARDKIGDGYNFTAGITLNLLRKVGVQVEYSFNGLGQREVQIPVSVLPIVSGTNQNFFADANFHYIDFSGALKPMAGSGAKANPYFIAGFGWYHRSVKVPTPAVGYVPGFCDPWWYVCYPGGFVPVEKIIGSRGSDDWGINFGAGVDFKWGENAAVYVEARYHYMWGPEVVDSTGKSYGNANGQFLPITVGIRF